MIKRYSAVTLLFAALLEINSHADTLVAPNTFTAGSPAVAAEVNANFSEVAGAVNDNGARIAELEADNETLLASNEELVARVAALENILTDITGVMSLQYARHG